MSSKSKYILIKRTIPELNLKYYTKERRISSYYKKEIENNMLRETYDYLGAHCKRERQILANMKNSIRRLGDGPERERQKNNIKKFEMENCVKLENLKTKLKKASR